MSNKIEIATTKEFDGWFKYYGYEEFVRKVLRNCKDKSKHGLTGKITLIDAEPSKRIYIENEQGEEFTVRYNIHSQNKNGWCAYYTLYKDSESISCDYATAKYLEVC